MEYEKIRLHGCKGNESLHDSAVLAMARRRSQRILTCKAPADCWRVYLPLLQVRSITLQHVVATALTGLSSSVLAQALHPGNPSREFERCISEDNQHNGKLGHSQRCRSCTLFLLGDFACSAPCSRWAGCDRSVMFQRLLFNVPAGGFGVQL